MGTTLSPVFITFCDVIVIFLNFPIFFCFAEYYLHNVCDTNNEVVILERKKMWHVIVFDSFWEADS